MGTSVLDGYSQRSLILFLDDVCKIQIICVLQTACQDQEEDEDDDEDGDQAELDSMLIECAGDLIPALAQALGGQTFAPYFAGALPLLLSRTVSITRDI